MSFFFVDRDWHKVFSKAVNQAADEILLITPFVQLRPVKELLGQKDIKVKLVTRFNLEHFYKGVSDLRALEFLLDMGAEIKGIRNLHAKAYVFDSSKAIVTSANLTHAALLRNHEFGLVTGNQELILEAKSYFESLWNSAGPCLTNVELSKWKKYIDRVQRAGGRSNKAHHFKDYGKDMGIPEAIVGEGSVSPTQAQWIVKFFGISSDRRPWDFSILQEVRRLGCHWACTFPKGKRPRKVRDGAIMFMGTLVKDPSDILIYGRAAGVQHEPGRDDATAADIELRDWKAKWPHYIRVRDAEFVAGQLRNGVSLNELMEKFAGNSFTSTERNMKLGHGNTNPRHAYLQQAAVELTPKAAEWLNESLETAFGYHGRLSEADLSKLDWPEGE